MRGSSSRESSKSRLPAERFATSSSWDNRAYESYKHQLGKTLLLGLEFLVAADVVRTVALEPTLTNVAVLGLLVVIRTFLSWSLTVEIEGRWPWQTRVDNAKSAQPTN